MLKRRKFFPLRLHWHSICLAVFLTIVCFDFLLFPAYYQFVNTRLTPESIVTISLKYPEPTNQMTVFQTLTQQRSWQPLTLGGGGLFYAAFGAILGIGAWKRTTPDMDDSMLSRSPKTPTSEPDDHKP